MVVQSLLEDLVHPPEMLSVLVRVPSVDDVLEELSGLVGVRVASPISLPGDMWLPLVAPSGLLESLPGDVYYDGLVGVGGLMRNAGGLSVVDPLLGRLSIPPSLIRGANPMVLGDPYKMLMGQTPLSEQILGTRFVPTGSVVTRTRQRLDPKQQGGGVTVGVIDTGFADVGQWRGRTPHSYSTVPGELPQDLLGHGGWTCSMVGGNQVPSVYGPVEGVAKEANIVSVKSLNTFPGTGMTSWILRGMERAVEAGAQILSMSLGSPLVVPVDEDPLCLAVRDLWEYQGILSICAAGNSGTGPDERGWQICSPGTSPFAITVGSWSWTDDDLSHFSSRGPNGEYYRDNPDHWEHDLETYGDSLIKPDVHYYGGGRKSVAAKPDELLIQASMGWTEGMYDGLRDLRCEMKGTSMSTPVVAGVAACIYDDMAGASLAKWKLELNNFGADR